MRPSITILIAIAGLLAAAGCSSPGVAPAPARGRALEASRASEDRVSAPHLPLPGAIPGDSELLDQLREAVDFRLREEFDRFLDARDPGELLEHATITQAALDRGIFGPEDLFVIGDELFDHEFRPEQGLGNGLALREGVKAGPGPAPNLRRVHQGEFGGPDSLNCSGCHSKGGQDGAGALTQNAYLRGDGSSTLGADERNPPHLLGLGPVAVLAREMSAELARRRDEAREEARKEGSEVRAPLEAKGVAFGTLRAFPDGSLDTSGVEGVDADLVVKPFGWKGHAGLEEIIEESFRIHLGLLSARDQKRHRESPASAPDLGDGPWYDVDRDGMSFEIEDGMVTSLASYLAQLEAPVIRPPEGEEMLERWGRGGRLFEDAGCASCHRPAMAIDDTVLAIRALDPQNAGRAPVTVDVARDGRHPKVEPLKLHGKSHLVRLFSDLKRHDLGPELASPAAQGAIPARVFLTRPLWGLASTAPYLHDGRAPTVDEAIRLHGGEAREARDRYLALPAADRAALRVFLLSLDRQPELFVP